MYWRTIRAALLSTILALLNLTSSASAQGDGSAKVIGRWDIVVHGQGGDFPSWLEIERSGTKTLVGSVVCQFGSARPISKVEFDNGQIRFAIPPQWERRTDDQAFEAKLEADVLHGSTTDEKGVKLKWEGQRAPALHRAQPPQWGEPIALFNGKDLTGWKPRSSSTKNGWTIRDGVLVNAEPGNDLRTEQTFTDFKLNAEFRYPKGSNSGIYLRGRYEVQIEDNDGLEANSHRIGGVYGFLTPSINAAKKAGEWQAIEIALVGRQVTVVLNGERIIDRQTIPGITGGALDSNEGQPGPLMIQGDHGVVEFRKVVLTPAK